MAGKREELHADEQWELAYSRRKNQRRKPRQDRRKLRKYRHR